MRWTSKSWWRVAVLLGLGRLAGAAEPAPLPPLLLAPEDRVLVLAPHPDDEVLGAAGVIQQALHQQLPVHVVFFTHGDANQWSFFLYRKHPVLLPEAVRRMGRIRRDEALSAGAVLGLVPDQMTFLGYPDFGTFSIWCEHWNEQRPPLPQPADPRHRSALP